MKFKKIIEKIGLNKGVIFGILFMILVLGVLVGVKMVMGEVTLNYFCSYPEGCVTPEGKYLSLSSGSGEGLNHLEKITSNQIKNINNPQDMGELLKNKAAKDIIKQGLNDETTARKINQASPKEVGKFLTDNYKFDKLDNSQITQVNNALHTSPKVQELLNNMEGYDKIQFQGNVDSNNLNFVSKNGESYLTYGNGNNAITLPANTPNILGVNAEGIPVVKPVPGVEANGAHSFGPANGAGPGGSGGSGAAGGAGQGLEKEAFAAAQQVLGLASQLGGPLKEALKKQPNAPVLYVPDGASGEVKLEEDKAATLVDSHGNSIVVVGKSGGSTISWNGQALQEIKMTNGNAIYFPYGAEANTYSTNTGETTTIENKLDSGNPVSTNTVSGTSAPTSTVAKFFLPFIKLIGFVSAEESITGEAIVASPDQFIKLIGYDAEISGKNINLGLLRPFDKVNGKGTDLNVYDGDVFINFKNMKTFYPRLVRENEFFVDEIRNDYDTKNLFMLVPGGAKGNYFVDGRIRLTVGDSVVKNPLDGYENIVISKARFEMWRKAAD